MSIILFENKKDCCGCWACYSVCPKSAISMQQDNEGFKYPIIDDYSCIECGLCQKVCPIRNTKRIIDKQKKKQHISVIGYDLIHNCGEVIAASVLENAIKEIVGDSCIVNTINIINDSSSTVDMQNVGLSDVRNCIPVSRDKDISRKQKFYVFIDTYMNKVEAIKSISDIDKIANRLFFVSSPDVKNINGSENDINLLDKKYKLITDFSDNQSFNPLFLHNADYYIDEYISNSSIKNENNPYVYVYMDGYNEKLIEYSKFYANENNLDIYYFSRFCDDFGENSKNCFTDGPLEYLSRIKNAEYVITDSYYATAFSIIFKKKFFAKESNAIIDLLSTFYLKSQISTENINNSIDYDKINDIIVKKRNDSILFLNEALNN